MALVCDKAMMMPDAANDDVVLRSDVDVRGEAALLLVESLIHGLLLRSGLSLADAIDIVQDAVDVQVEIGDARGDHPGEVVRATNHLLAIKQSLSIDLS